MGWNSSVVLVEGRSLAQVKKTIPDVFAVTDRVVGWEGVRFTVVEFGL